MNEYKLPKRENQAGEMNRNFTEQEAQMAPTYINLSNLFISQQKKKKS